MTAGSVSEERPWSSFATQIHAESVEAEGRTAHAGTREGRVAYATKTCYLVVGHLSILRSVIQHLQPPNTWATRTSELLA